MKKPWYIWTSIFGFMVLFFVLGLKTVHRLFRRDSAALDRWVPALGVIIGLWVGCLMLPGWLLSLLLDWADPSLGWLVLIYVYLIGVLITIQLDQWKKKHFD